MLEDSKNNQWLGTYLFPEKQAMEKGYCLVDFEWIHKELQKKNFTLTLLHNEYARAARGDRKVPHAYRTFVEKYGNFAKKC